MHSGNSTAVTSEPRPLDSCRTPRGVYQNNHMRLVMLHAFAFTAHEKCSRVLEAYIAGYMEHTQPSIAQVYFSPETSMGDRRFAFFLDVLVSQPMRILRADFYIKAIFILEHVQIRVLSDVVRNPTNLQHQLPVLLIYLQICRQSSYLLFGWRCKQVCSF